MSKFANGFINAISPYIAGEQPQDKTYVKLNTNENPYYTAKSAVAAVDGRLLEGLNRYSDPESMRLRAAIAEYYRVLPENVMVTNGSDEALAFAFYAFCVSGVCYPDVTYGFYDVVSRLFGCGSEHIALKSDFTIDYKAFLHKNKTVVLANPNAQTAIELARESLIKIIEGNPENVVIVDQAYADFGSYNAIELIKKYPNLITVNTFSKSRSLAGARVGYIVASAQLIEDLNKVKNSFHPYNVNSVSAVLAARAIEDDDYFTQSVEKIRLTRGRLIDGLRRTGFDCLPSAANFVLAKHGKIGGAELYKRLKERGVLVRHFDNNRINDYIRITVGTDVEMKKFMNAVGEILAEI